MTDINVRIHAFGKDDEGRSVPLKGAFFTVNDAVTGESIMATGSPDKTDAAGDVTITIDPAKVVGGRQAYVWPHDESPVRAWKPLKAVIEDPLNPPNMAFVFELALPVKNSGDVNLFLLTLGAVGFVGILGLIYFLKKKE